MISENLRKELENLIRKKVFDDDEFVLGAFAFINNDKDCKEVIEFIKIGNDVTTDTVMGLILELDDQYD